MAASDSAHSDRTNANRQSGWAAELKAYEREKRVNLDPGLFKGPTVGFSKGEIAKKERSYNPLIGRFLDDKREQEQRAFESEVRTEFMNRARDVQLRKEAPFDLVTHEKKFEAIQPLNEFLPPEKPDQFSSKLPFPDTCVEYNIVSNIPLDQHHYAHPDQRPRPKDRVPKRRMIPAMLHKDFNVLTNRYLRDHEAKTERDRELMLLECAQKHRQHNVFDPVNQTYCDDRMEQNMRACEDAMTTEIKLRGEDAQPLTHRGNITSTYDMITHQVRNPELMKLICTAEEERKARFKTRRAIEEDCRRQDIIMDDAAIQSKYDKTAHQRFEETAQRGYDIVTCQRFGKGQNDKRLHQPKTKPGPTPWEKVFEDRHDLVMPPSALEANQNAPRHGSSRSSGPQSTAQQNVTTLRLPSSSAGRPPSGALSARTTSTASRAARAAAEGALGSSRRSMTPRSDAYSGSARMPPPPPAIPGSPVGSVYSRPRG
eukprot:gb/GFBE01063350.1/.p1 GENE.gb/GFBE01063350.1/~~gb/GFBE01063350.1/.p1  ORF type:complete len:484 (+),score=78.85 gb/GFBE01063350.1/:1-1452(+)